MGDVAHGFSEVEPVSHNIICSTKIFSNTPSGPFVTTVQSKKNKRAVLLQFCAFQTTRRQTCVTPAWLLISFNASCLVMSALIAVRTEQHVSVVFPDLNLRLLPLKVSLICQIFTSLKPQILFLSSADGGHRRISLSLSHSHTHTHKTAHPEIHPPPVLSIKPEHASVLLILPC